MSISLYQFIVTAVGLLGVLVLNAIFGITTNDFVFWFVSVPVVIAIVHLTKEFVP